jgi:hypothetical protein
MIPQNCSAAADRSQTCLKDPSSNGGRNNTGGDTTTSNKTPTPVLVVSPHKLLVTACYRPVGAPPAAPAGYQENENAFPFLLHNLLEDAERRGFDNVISWVQGGKAFKIHNREQLAEYVLPNYFARSSSQYRSFHRQLNLYSFSRDKLVSTSRGEGGPSAGGKN